MWSESGIIWIGDLYVVHAESDGHPGALRLPHGNGDVRGGRSWISRYKYFERVLSEYQRSHRLHHVKRQHDNRGDTLVYGDLRGPYGPCGIAAGTPGLTFYPVGTPPGAGNFLFAQIVTGDSSVYNGAGSTTTCTAVSGVDGAYPYQNQVNPPSTSDSPELQLPNAVETITRNFNATMYLLWQPIPIATSIPVPLGYIPWTFNATATNGGTAQAPVWTASGFGAPVASDGQLRTEGMIGSDEAVPDLGGSNPAFVAATTISDIPIWSGPTINASANCRTVAN